MPEVSGQSFLCLSNVEWGVWRHRHHHLMERFAHSNRMGFVETLGARTPNLLSARDLARIGARLGRVVRSARPGDDPSDLPENVELLSPLVAPFHGPAALRRLNLRLLRRSLGPWLAQGPNPILWVYLPTRLVGDLVEATPHRLLVYDCVDDITAFRGAPPGLAESEEWMIRRADLVFASARLLEDKCRAWNPAVHYVPNAADVDLFEAGSQGPDPPELAGLPRPRVGYVGSIREWFDVPLVLAAAQRFPDASFVLVGDEAPELAPLRSLPNVHLLGMRPYRTVPAILGALDVGLIPFQDSPLIRSTHPIKVYEYLAAGCAVISTPMLELQGISEVDVEPPGPGFLEALGRRLAEGRAPQAVRRRREAVRGETWDARFAVIDRILAAAIERTERSRTTGG